MSKLAYESQAQIEALRARVQALVVQLNLLYKNAREIEIDLPGINRLKELFLDIRTGSFLLPLSRKIRDSKYRTERLISEGNGVIKPLLESRQFILQSSDDLVIVNTEALESFCDQYRFFINDAESESVNIIKTLADHLIVVRALRERQNSMGFALFTIQQNDIISNVLKLKS